MQRCLETTVPHGILDLAVKYPSLRCHERTQPESAVVGPQRLTRPLIVIYRNILGCGIENAKNCEDSVTDDTFFL